MLIRDSIALGAVTGVAATVPQLIVNYISFQLGFAKYYAFQLSGGIYLLKNLTDNLWGLILGGIVWEFTAAFLGIVTVYLLRWTGRDYWWLKGVLVSNAIMFIIIYGFVFGLVGPKVVPRDIETNFSVLLENLIFGVTTAYLIVRWGEGLLHRKPGEL
ncbi:MAG: hypothetical protein ACOY4Q_11410 [Bacillota bacterium]